MSTWVRYSFHCQETAEGSLSVTSVIGEEAVSQLYRYEIELRTSKLDLDLDVLLANPCCLSMKVAEHERVIHGILSDAEILGQFGDQLHLRVVLVPRLWQLGLFTVNEVYIGKKIGDIARMILAEGGFTSLDYEINLVRQYREWPYRCQYGETHLEYLLRIFSREGIYFYFEQGDSCEKLVIVDHLQFHQKFPWAAVTYDPVSGLEGLRYENSVQSLVCRQKRLAKTVILRDYNDEKPSVDITGQASVDTKGMGEINIFGLNIASKEEGAMLAETAAEAIKATRKVFHIESTVPTISCGFMFELERHFLKDFNQEYFVCSFTMQGYDPTAEANMGRTDAPYCNTFTAIAADVQYRPELIADRQKIHGTLDALIDAEGDGQYAELDDQGRYKVILPFDRQQRAEGKASHWIRMSQAFAGEVEGMHFPLRKGTHVLLSFIGGDPDRPVITGAMPNAAQPSVVSAENQTKSKIQTRAGNFMEIEDKEGSNRIKFFTPHCKTYFHMGAHNAPGDGYVAVTEGIERNEIGGGSQSTYVVKSTLTAWKADAGSSDSKVIEDSNDQLFNEQNIFAFSILGDDGKKTRNMTSEIEVEGNYHIFRRVGDVYTWTDGNTYTYGGSKDFSFGNSYEENHAKVKNDDTDKGIPDSDTFDIPATMSGASGYAPDNGFVSKTWGDSFTYANGNNYTWGDTKDYSFGNGYEEIIVKESDWRSSGVNANWDHDKYSGLLVSINPDTALVSKIIGDQYNYTKGDTRDVYVGRIEENFWGVKHAEYYGREEEFYFGGSSDIFVGGKSEIYIGGFNSLSIALGMETYVGAKLEFFLGAKAEGHVGPKEEFGPADIKAKLTELKTNASSIASAAVDIVANSSAISAATVGLYSAGAKIKSAATDIANGAIAIKNAAAVRLQTSGINLFP